METYTLKAKIRNIIGKKVKKIREQGLIPAVVYGADKAPVSLSVDEIEFDKMYRAAGSSSIVKLDIEDKELDNVLVQEPQYNPRNGHPQHIDFLRVKMNEKIKTEIPLTFEGESKAIEQLGGTLVTPFDKLEVECLPTDLVSEIIIDISNLGSFDDQIKISDLKIPSGIEIQIDSNQVLALVEPPRSEEEMAELETSTTEEEQKAVEEATAAEEPTEETDDGENKEAEKETK